MKIVVNKTTFISIYADANVLWKVIGKINDDHFTCEIVNEPFIVKGVEIPSDYAGVQKPFTRTSIERALQYDKALNDSKIEGEKFYNSLSVGDIVHYMNGAQQFVRCEVVRENNDKALLPIGLLGKWHSSDLPHRMANGEIYYPYYAKAIKDRKTFLPHHSNIAEFAKLYKDLKNMSLISLEVAEATEEEKRLAEKYLFIESILGIIHSNEDVDVKIKKIVETANRYDDKFV